VCVRLAEQFPGKTVEGWLDRLRVYRQEESETQTTARGGAKAAPPEPSDFTGKQCPE